jgi:hypothetical protein
VTDTTAPAAPAADDASSTSRAAKLAVAVRSWRSQLLDLSANNSLLYYKDRKTATVDLTAAEPAMLDQLLARQPVRLSALLGAHAPDNVGKRGTTIRKKAVENYEERGVQTLLFTWGIATWQDDTAGKSQPRAPLLLFPPPSFGPPGGRSRTTTCRLPVIPRSTQRSCTMSRARSVRRSTERT